MTAASPRTHDASLAPAAATGTDAVVPHPSVEEAARAAKKSVRISARRVRAALELDRAAASKALADNFLDALPQITDGLAPVGLTVAFYWPVGDEIDPRPLMHRVVATGIKGALPVCQAKGLPLLFRRWWPGTLLSPDIMGVPAPMEEAAPGGGAVMPDVVLVPLLAFDRRGGRLGYGAGFYDRTLAQLRRERAIQAVGIAFADQELDKVPCDAHDQRLDWIVTERYAVRAGQRRKR
ncbi:5-formyltetrahydrofolate cyclo-ligase [Nitrospirillum sp. BR 11828]|uniref:5-formyltetrahydrofolate cyclo-ligase n=1 Tax=Nitrospirillum sp. BR 11828 TaxID=3104325 RepID=UPI002ACA7A1C|nr:5-formyltetrahydrofolate cyclo-ligase [Nitrospirillum sp. BR 11828]MDZ5647539.1 5-formyltetrahydrofolate cyclo-ligase [Nitrospirillum sp. BR 11828]